MFSHHIRWSVAVAIICTFSGGVAVVNATPITSGLQIWLKADAIPSLSNGQNVTEWLDSSAEANSAYSALQNTAANRPIFRTGGPNGMPYVQFEDSDLATSGNPASDDWMAITSDNVGTRADFDGLLIDTGGVTVFAVLNATGSRNRAPMLGGNNGRLDFTASNLPRVRTYREANLATTDTGVPTGFFIAEYQHTDVGAGASNTASVYLNGSSAASNSFTNSGNALLNELVNLGATDETSDAFFGGELAELLVYRGVLSESDRNAVGVYLENKYALNATYVPEPASAGIAIVGLVTLIWTRTRATCGPR